MKSLIDIIKKSPGFSKIEQKISKGESADIFGITPSFKPYLLSAFTTLPNRGLLWITSSWDNCEKIYERAYPFIPPGLNNRFGVFPELKELGDHDLTPSLRMKVLEMLGDKRPVFIVAPFRALLDECEEPENLVEESVNLWEKSPVKMESFLNRLDDMGYVRNFQVERRGEYSQRGGIVDFYPSTSAPVRVEFFGDEIDSIRYFDLDNQTSTEKIKSFRLFQRKERKKQRRLLEIIDPGWIVVVDEPDLIKIHATRWNSDDSRDLWNDFLFETRRRNLINIASWSADTGKGITFDTGPVESFGGDIEKLLENTSKWQKQDEFIVISSQHNRRLKELFKEKEINGVKTDPDKILKPSQILLLPGDIYEGFVWRESALRLVTDKEILGKIPRKKRVLRAWDRSKAVDLTELKPGDLVVHLSHGIGKFLGLHHMEVQNSTRDFVQLEYNKGDKLFVPVQQLDLLQKYIGQEGRGIGLSRLGGVEWTRARQKARKATEEMAEELLGLYAERERAVGHSFGPDTPWQLELEASFPFDETEDQTKAIDNIKGEMESDRPMDHLLCGDAGYGKTEVALRAAFKAVQEGKQVAVIAPTTILTAQHFETFTSRLKTFPVGIEMLSRFRTKKEQKETILHVADKTADVVIGTHRLLQKDIKFMDLGLIIVDEEQHFGVRHKEKLKKMKSNVDVLTLTATPIPRTLHMALSGLRSLTVIETPPEDRLPVKTYLNEFDPELIRAAIVRELERGGQVFFLHNRVKGIEKIAQDISRLVPFAKIATAHGQMDENELELIMMDFNEGLFDILVCTTIIESGLDMPNVNTIIVNNAQNFGLSQLYQLRGRVGRSNHQAFAYLLYPGHMVLTEEAEQRLEAIRELSHLGAGFQIAMKDLEIRGAGNLLGSQQSGHIAAVGFELYCDMLKEAVDEKRGIERERKIDPPLVDLPVNTFIPENYISNSKVKLEMYRRIADIEKIEDIPGVVEEFRDRFGPLPLPLMNLLEVLKIKLLAWDLGAPFVKDVQGKVQILLPGVKEIKLKKIQDIYAHTGIKSYFHKSVMYLEELTAEKTKSIIPGENPIEPEIWLPKIQRLLELLLKWKKDKRL